MGHGLCRGKPGNVRHGGARSHVEKDAITSNRPSASVVQMHLDRPGSQEVRFTSNQIWSGGLEAIEMKSNLALDHPSFAAQDTSHIRRHRPGLDAVIRSVPGEPGSFRAANHILARQAGNIRTRSADVL